MHEVIKRYLKTQPKPTSQALLRERIAELEAENKLDREKFSNSMVKMQRAIAELENKLLVERNWR